MAEQKKTTTRKSTTKKNKEITPDVIEEVKISDEEAPVEVKTETEEKKKTYTAEDIENVLQSEEAQSAIQKMIAQALAQAQAAQQTIPQNVVAIPVKEETVSLLYMGVVAPGSTVHLNDRLGDIQGRAGTRDIPKSEFLQNLTPPVLKRLKDRRLIVLDGLTKDERERYGIEYTEGELLSPQVYHKIFTWDDDKIVEVFTKACKKHKEVITTLVIDAYIAHNKRVTQSLVERLNDASKEADPAGMFTAILKDMARDLASR